MKERLTCFLSFRIYSNLLHILTKQLDPLLIPVVFYHDRSAPAPFVVAQNLQQSKPSSGHVRESLRPGHTSSSSSVPSSRISNLPSVSRNTSPPHLLTSLAIAKPAHADFSCTKNGNDILLVLSRMFHHLMSHNVYCAVVQQFFTQVPENHSGEVNNSLTRSILTDCYHRPIT